MPEVAGLCLKTAWGYPEDRVRIDRGSGAGAALLYRFEDFEVDTGAFEVRRRGAAVHVEPRVFDLIRLLVDNPGTVVDRDRMLAEVWSGRIVSDATLATAVKGARRALDDTGSDQRLIETVRSRGFRFRGVVSVDRPPAAAREPMPVPPPEPARAALIGGRPSIAVLPLVRLGDPATLPGLEEAVPHEVIVALARLRWLFVIAPGSSFQLRGAEAQAPVVAARLGVRYFLTGSIEASGARLAIAVELAETATGGVVWADRFAGAIDDVHALRAEIVAGIAAALELEIQLHEALRAQSAPPDRLDAWAAFHLGLQRVHEYTPEGNAAALGFFERAAALEPSFARAHAGLSFAHFQNAFLHYRRDREAEIALACRAAERGVELDPLDPFANLTMGRSFWLRQELDAALPWLERATEISPNYAKGHYSQALVQILAGATQDGVPHVERAMALSPIDPLLYAMRAAKALAALADGDVAAAAHWADVAARTPRAHVLIAMIAMACDALAGDLDAARRRAVAIRGHRPAVSRAHFFAGLPVHDAATRAGLEEGFRRCGF